MGNNAIQALMSTNKKMVAITGNIIRLCSLPTVPATKLNRPSTAISTKFWNRPGIIAALRAPKMNNSTKTMLAIQEERMALVIMTLLPW